MPGLELLIDEDIDHISNLDCYIHLPWQADDLNGSTLHVTLWDIYSGDIVKIESLELVLDSDKPRGMAQFIADVYPMMTMLCNYNVWFSNKA